MRDTPLPITSEEREWDRQRLVALRRYRIRGGESSLLLDSVAHAVAARLGVPISVVSFVEESEQVFGGRAGLTLASTPRKTAFCAYAICQDDLFTVFDAKNDPRFKDSPLVQDDIGVEFYAGVPFFAPDGFPLGAVGIMAHEHRDLSAGARAFITEMARSVEHALAAFLDDDAVRGPDPSPAGDMTRGDPSLRSHPQGTDSRKLAQAVDQTADSVLITDTRGIIEYVNRAWCEGSGYSADEAVGNAASLVKSGEHDKAFYQDLWSTITSGRPWTGELVNRRKDGSLFIEQKTITPIRDDQGELTHFVSTGKDITQQRSLQAELHQAQKMEALGRLAGGLAHDFKNILTVITGSALLALEDAEDLPDDVVGLLSEINAASEAAGALTRQLLAFGRKKVVEPQPLDLNEIVESYERMIGRLIGETIRVSTDLTPDLPAVLIDETQFAQVLLNLAVNARDAMPAGGSLELATRLVELPGGSQVGGHSLTEGPYVTLTVTDTGMGMDEAVRARAFDPFFTTKMSGEGTGLGLSTVFGILTQLGGSIGVETAPGKGARFTLYLPAQDIPAVSPKPSIGKHGEGRILVVDDQEPVRRLICGILREGGYTVSDARTAEDAIGLVVSGNQEFDAIVADLMLPGMTGGTMASLMKMRFPDLPILYVTGYDSTVVNTSNLTPSDRLLRKPFSPPDLLDALAALMETPDSTS